MQFGACTAVVLLICLVCEGQANNVILTTSSLGSFGSTSSINFNLGQANTSLNGLVNSIKGLVTSAQTEELQSAIDVLKPLVELTSDIGFGITGTLSKLILDPTTPLPELFDQFEKEVKDIKKIAEEGDFIEILRQIKETFGCVREEQYKSKLSDVYSIIKTISRTVSQIREIALRKEDHLRKLDIHPAQLKSLVDALGQDIKDYNDAVTAFVKVVKSTVDGIEKANSFLKGLISKEDMTRSDLNSTAIRTNSTVDNQSKNVQNKYEAAQLAMKTDLTNALKGVNIFSSSKHFKDLVKDNKKAYTQFYNFLKKRSQSDLSDIVEYYSKLGNRTAKTINQTADIFIDAVHRTGLRLADVVLEGGLHADSCYTTFNTKFYAPFLPLSTFVSSCVMKEMTRWTAIATAVDDVLKLAQTDSKELSSNLGRCSSMYTNFASSSEDYVQAETCLKTNLEDLEDLPKVLEPQLQNVNQLVKREAKASIFRVENCLITNLHEGIAKLKFMRSAIDICAGSADHCPRKDHDDDKKERHHREREHDDNTCKTVIEEEGIWK